MIINQVPKPDGFDHYEQLTENFDSLLQYDLDEIWYWYGYDAPGYSGTGVVLYTKGGRWDVHNMSHCSCFSGLDKFEERYRYASLQDLIAACSEDFLRELEPCIAAVSGRSKQTCQKRRLSRDTVS